MRLGNWLLVIQEIWKLKISDSAKTLLSVLVIAVGLGFAIWSEVH